MGKREDVKFEKKPRDSYFTIDPIAVEVLNKHLPLKTRFIEPCAGAGDLFRELQKFGHECLVAYDIEPQTFGITQRNCLSLDNSVRWLAQADCLVTNPPFTWKVLQPIMDHLISLLPTWLLLPADFMHNVRMGPYMKQCEKVISVGRMYWMPNKVKGVESMCWYLFNKDHKGPTEFIGR